MHQKDQSNTIVIQSDDTFTLYKGNALKTHGSLPVGTYNTTIDPFGVINLIGADNFQFNSKIYGNTKSRTDKILNTFVNRSQSTGVLLSGQKGSGKTLLAKYISHKGVQQGYSTIMVTPNVACSDNFIHFMSMITDPVIVIFDEFEKMFEKSDEQNHLLSMFDGLGQNKKLYILTINSISKVSEYFISRPGRIYYKFDYSSVDEDTIREVCADNDMPEIFTDKIVDYTTKTEEFSFDSLIAIIDEYKRYPGEFDTVIDGLNINVPPKYRMSDSYTLKAYIDGMKSSITISDNISLSNYDNFFINVKDATIASIKNHIGNDADDVKLFLDAISKDSDNGDDDGVYIDIDKNSIVYSNNDEKFYKSGRFPEIIFMTKKNIQYGNLNYNLLF